MAGSLAAAGAIGLELAVLACFSGIFVSDIGLYLIGRGSGRAAARSRVFRRLVSPYALERAAGWLEKRGPAAIFISRFVSGLRLPTYLAAGFLKVSFARFAAYLFIAAAIWTPFLVGAAYYAQVEIFGSRLLIGTLLLFASIQAAFALISRKRRRRLVGFFKRIYRWEFWPVQIFYLPVLFYVVFLAFRYRSLTVFTSANPAIPGGGFAGESKDEIYSGLKRSVAARPHLLRHIVVDPSELSGMNEAEMSEFVRLEALGFPLVLKPDTGERGKGVRIVRTPAELSAALENIDGRQILQEFARGEEFSVFYYRYPGESKGRIFSITDKIFPSVTGNGISTVEELILADPRAVCIHSAYLDNIGSEADRIASPGEEVRLIEIGTHSRGAIFNDGDRVRSDKLEAAIDRICRGFEGFYFGRFDLRVSSEDDLREGRGFKIVELNGVTSESTNIYDRRYSIIDAYRILLRQWKIAFEIGHLNRARGASPASVSELVSMYIYGSRAEPSEEPA